MADHELKTDPAVFAAVRAGTKTYEIRFNDRSFAVGDTLLLRETVSTGQEMREKKHPLQYTGRTEQRTVSHILTGYGLAEGWCILSFAEAARAAVPAQAGAAERRVAELESVLQAVEQEFKQHGDKFPDGFNSRVFRWVEDALVATHPPAQVPAPDLSKLQRYTVNTEYEWRDIRPVSWGEYVKLADVQALVAANAPGGGEPSGQEELEDAEILAIFRKHGVGGPLDLKVNAARAILAAAHPQGQDGGEKSNV